MPPRFAQSRVFLAAAIAAIAIVLRAPSFFRPLMDIDESSYAAIACRMMQGGLPYRDGVENKFPAIYYVYYAVYSLFGRYDMIAVHALVTTFAIATAFVCGDIARRLTRDDRAGWLAALAYVVFSTFYYPKLLAANTEMFLVLPSSLAIGLAIRAREHRGLWILAGAAAAGALLFKQVGIVVVCALLADRAWRVLREGGRAAGSALIDLLLILIGFGAVCAAMVAYLRARGILDDAVFWTWTYAWRHYLPSGNKGDSFAFNLLTAFLPFLACVGPAVFFAARAWQDELSLLWWWLFGCVAASLVGGRMYGHYFVLFLPALCTLAGAGCAGWLDGASLRNVRLVAGSTAIAAFAFFAVACLYEGSTGTFLRPTPDYRRAAEYVRSVTRPDERIFVWGWFPGLYVAADRCPSTRFIYAHIFVGQDPRHSNWHRVPEAWPMLMKDLSSAPPPYILDSSIGDYNFDDHHPEQYPELWQFIQDNYVEDRTIEGIRIFRRKG